MDDDQKLPDYVFNCRRSSEKSVDVPIIIEALASENIQNMKLATHVTKEPEPFRASDKRSPSPKPTKNDELSYEEFLEDVAIFMAQHSGKDPRPIPAASASPGEIFKYREAILNDKETRRRFVFQDWPRDPESKNCIKPENSAMGKMAPNGLQIWGATLKDFYFVRRLPEFVHLRTSSSGSKLAAWMKSHGETYVQDLIEAAEREADPHLIFPYNITMLIKTDETFVRDFNKSWIRKDRKGKTKETDRKHWELPTLWPPASPFDPIAYPYPWPRKPFDRFNRIPTLQNYIPQSLLPAKLVVHDPWKLLNPQNNGRWSDTEEEDNKEIRYDWDTKKDIIHVYKLQISKDEKRTLDDDAEAEANLANRAKARNNFLADPHTKHEPNLPSGFFMYPADAKPGPAKPPVFVVFPLQANREQAPEAHLYLSPKGKIGEGNHSFVYEAEFELPRNQLIDEVICRECILDDVAKRFAEEDGMDREKRDPKWNELSGRYVLKTKKTPTVVTKTKHPITGKMTTYRIEDEEETHELVYEGPVRAIESRIQYQDLSKAPYCKHLQGRQESIHPLTSTVHVAVKLSIQHDKHLANEAKNYQAFPRHFFENWSGYNIINPLHHPVPVGPVVPQFYGYYVVDEEEEKKLRAVDVDGIGDADEQDMQVDEETPKEEVAQEWESDEEHTPQSFTSKYLSPILLIEDCGKPIQDSKLSVDDREQSASLIYRFHEEGWIHGSVAKRNILRQSGPLNTFPLDRAINAGKRGGLGEEWSFRLIDFGRSHKTTENLNLISEESKLTGWVFGYDTLSS